MTDDLGNAKQNKTLLAGGRQQQKVTDRIPGLWCHRWEGSPAGWHHLSQKVEAAGPGLEVTAVVGQAHNCHKGIDRQDFTNEAVIHDGKRLIRNKRKWFFVQLIINWPQMAAASSGGWTMAWHNGCSRVLSMNIRPGVGLSTKAACHFSRPAWISLDCEIPRRLCLWHTGDRRRG